MRKNLMIIVVVFVLALIAYYLVCLKVPQTNQLTVPAYIEEATTSLWQNFQPENGTFQALFPTTPKHASATEAFGTSNEPISYDVYSTATKDGTQYTISMAQYPESFDISKPTLVLQAVLQDMATGTPKNDIIGQTSLEVQGNTAMDFDLQNLQYATLGRAVLSGKTLYVLTVKNPDRNNLEKNFHTFANSFKIISKGP